MSEARRGVAVRLFSYGQLESKDETEEVTLVDGISGLYLEYQYSYHPPVVGRYSDLLL